MHPFLDDAVWHARRYGCRVMYADLGGRNGQVHRSGLIKVNPDRNLIVQRETLLHEVGHWSMGHSDCMWNRRSDRREMAADKFAPDLIFSPLEYAIAERAYGTDPRTLGPARRNPVPDHRLPVPP